MLKYYGLCVGGCMHASLWNQVNKCVFVSRRPRILQHFITLARGQSVWESTQTHSVYLPLCFTHGIVYGFHVCHDNRFDSAARAHTHTHTHTQSSQPVWSRWIHTPRLDLQTIITRQYKGFSHLYLPRVSVCVCGCARVCVCYGNETKGSHYSAVVDMPAPQVHINIPPQTQQEK